MAIYPSGSIINNRYEVVPWSREKLCLAGGMGIVYLCVDHAEDGRPVALKTFRPELLPDRTARDRFLREGTTWVELGNHPHIVRCYKVIKSAVGSEVFFVLELVAAAEGKSDASLRSWLTSGKPLPVEQNLLFALHLARGMKHATEKIPGLVHRDLKPENVLVGRDGVARITDFGLASAMQETADQLPVAGAKESQESGLRRTQLSRGIMGTPLYMAPEQWAGTELDARSDIYAYGCILYEMLTGKLAVDGKTVEEIEKAHRSGQVAEISSTLPHHLSHLLQRCVKMNREERYDNWLELESEVAAAWKSVMGKESPAAPDSSPDLSAERVAAGWSYNAMGASYLDIGKFSVAQDYFAKALAIGRQEGERSLQAVALGNLGSAYLQLGNAHGAIGYHEQRLAISREIGDRHGEAQALGNLGTAYLQLGDAHRAIGYYEQTLAIAHELGDRQSKGTVLGGLGNAYLQLGDVRGAIGYYEQHLAIVREIGDRHGEGRALGNLGIAYRQLGDARGAIGYFEQVLAIMREVGDRQGEGSALGGLGNAYFQLGDARGAIGYHEQVLAIMREVGDRQGEGQTLGNLGAAYAELGDARGAIGYFEEHLVIASEIGDIFGAGMASINLALLFLQQSCWREAEVHAVQAAQIFTQAGHSEVAARAQQLLAQIRSQKG